MPQDKGGAPDARDWSETLFLPKTDFPMRAGLPKREPEFLKRWAEIDLYAKLREANALENRAFESGRRFGAHGNRGG